MATLTKTFSFLTTAESFVAAQQATNTTLSYDGATGNPAGALKARRTGKSQTKASSYWEWTGTWQALGVPAGSTITAIQLSSAQTRCTEYTTGASSNIGPYELRDSAGTTLIGTLWAGRTITAADAGWVAVATQTAVTVPSHASSTTVKIRLTDQLATGNSTSAAISTYDDEISLIITYTPPSAPSAPGSVTANITGEANSISWTASTNVTDYTLFRGASGDTTHNLGNTTSLSANDVDYEAIVAYPETYWVRANGPGGTANSATSNSVTSTPNSPANLTASPGDSKVDLAWTAKTYSGVTYKIYRNSALVFTTAVGASTWSDTGLTNGTQYSYTITAVRNSVESAQSSAATATPDSYEAIRPISTVTVGGWTVTGAATLNQAIDEVNDNQSDYITGPTTPAFAEVALAAPVGTPAGRPSRMVMSAFTNGIGADGSYFCKLMQGATTISTGTVVTGNGVWQRYEFYLSQAEQNSISNWSDLRLRFDFNGGSDIFEVSQAYLDVPVSASASPISGNDAGSLSATETSSVAIINYVSTSDSGTLSANEVSSFGTVAVSASDSGSISGAETSGNSVSLSTTDAGTVSATETSGAAVSNNSSDAGTISGQETSSVVVSISSSDSGTISATEARSFAPVAVTTSDSGTISAAESRTTTAALSTSDSGSISATETSQGYSAITSSDSGTISAAETSSISVSLSGNDSGSLSATETTTAFKQISSSDSGTISATESSSVFLDRPGADNGALSVTESSSVAVFGNVNQSSVDQGTFSAGEQSNVASSTSTSDSGSISATESSSVAISGQVSKSATDSGSLSATESSAVQAGASAQDSGTISATESSANAISGTVTKAASDSGTTSVNEQVMGMSASLSSTDSGSMGVTEATASQVTVGKPIYAWNGTSWIPGIAKVWDGTAWVQKPVKIYNGTTWV